MVAPQGGALGPDHILDIVAGALPAVDQSQAVVKNPYEAVALVGHACMVAIDFRLIGLGEEHQIG
jgi:PI31 proteasome regulator N-terminal